MDIQRPIPNQKLRADWGRAVADAIRAGRLEGDGTFRSPVGSSVAPIQPPAVPPRPPRPPFCTVFTAKTEEGEAVQGLTVRPGHVWWVADNATTEVPYVGTDGDFDTLGTGDGFEGETWADYDLPEGDFYVYASVAFSSGAPTSWTLAAGASLTPATGRRNYPVALVTRVGDYGGLSVEQLRLGEFILGPGAAGSSGGGEGEGEGEGEGGGSSGGGGGGGADHWGASSSDELSPQVNSDSTSTGAVDHLVKTDGAKGIVHLSGTWLDIPSDYCQPGHQALIFRQQKIDFYVDSKGNVTRIKCGSRAPAQSISFPLGSTPSASINSIPSANPSTLDSEADLLLPNSGNARHINLTKTWLDDDGRYCQQRIVLSVDTYGAIRRIHALPAAKSSINTAVSGANGTIISPTRLLIKTKAYTQVGNSGPYFATELEVSFAGDVFTVRNGLVTSKSTGARGGTRTFSLVTSNPPGDGYTEWDFAQMTQ